MSPPPENDSDASRLERTLPRELVSLGGLDGELSDFPHVLDGGLLCHLLLLNGVSDIGVGLAVALDARLSRREARPLDAVENVAGFVTLEVELCRRIAPSCDGRSAVKRQEIPSLEELVLKDRNRTSLASKLHRGTTARHMIGDNANITRRATWPLGVMALDADAVLGLGDDVLDEQDVEGAREGCGAVLVDAFDENRGPILCVGPAPLEDVLSNDYVARRLEFQQILDCLS